MPHKYTEDQSNFISEHVKGTGTKELTEMFNSHFGLTLKSSLIRAFKKNHNLKSGLDATFKKGQIPPNKGTHIGGWKPTQFKTGHRPHNYLQVGSERINGDGYLDIKIADPHKWRGKHILVWEENNGPLPKGYCIIFGDRDRCNFEPNNLIMVSRQQLAVLNNNNLIKNDADLTRTGVIIADLYQKINKLKRDSI